MGRAEDGFSYFYTNHVPGNKLSGGRDGVQPEGGVVMVPVPRARGVWAESP